MTKNSFEVYTLRSMQWQLDCIFNAKQDATNEAWRIFNAGHFDGVKVIHESYDEKINRATARIILNRLKGDEKKQAVRRKAAPRKHESRTRVKAPVANKKKQKKRRSALHFGMLGIAVCVTLLGLVIVAFVLVDRF